MLNVVMLSAMAPAEMAGSEKHTILQSCIINYSCKKFMIADPRGNQLWRQKLVKTGAVVSTIKLFTLVITNCIRR